MFPDIVVQAIDQINDSEVALLVGHGGWIEPTVIAAVGMGNVEDWGPAFGHLEGVRLPEQDGVFEVVAVHRRT